MSFLEEVVRSTKEVVDEQRRDRPLREVVRAALAVHRGDRSFLSTLRGPDIALIAEFKRSSPSKQALASPDATVEPYVDEYAQGGARALSILTEKHFFLGCVDDLRAARARTELPILRKDFVIDEYQVYEAAEIGADAVLLIAAVLQDHALFSHLYDLTRSLGLDVLLEVRNHTELDRALALDADLIGINNRNLKTRPSSPRAFEIDTDRTMRLLGQIPPSVTVVAESGLKERSELDALEGAGVRAALVGSALMQSPDRTAMCEELTRSPRVRAGAQVDQHALAS